MVNYILSFILLIYAIKIIANFFLIKRLGIQKQLDIKNYEFYIILAITLMLSKTFKLIGDYSNAIRHIKQNVSFFQEGFF